MIAKLPRQSLTRCLGVVVALMSLLLGASPSLAFQLQDIDDNRVELEHYVGDGRWTLVMFWSTDCVPCEQQKPMIESFHRDHQAQDAHVVGVVLDGLQQRDLMLEMIARHDTSYINLIALSDVFQRQFREFTGKDFRATPTYILFEPTGSMAGVRAGPIEREMLESVLSGS